MNYPETLHYLYQKLPIFSRIGAAAYKADVGNTLSLCHKLSHPETKFKSIHVAGTNGKGSCSHMLASIFQEAGYKTGLYTSPHLIDFRERIKINGEEIGMEKIVEFVEALKPVIDELQPSFFEVTVAMAFTHFANQKVDIAIIETGLGGLLDSTNVILPELSVITNISYDHTNLLGSTLPEIAYQKAGIIKTGIPVIIGETQAVCKDVFLSKAQLCNSPILFADNEYEVKLKSTEQTNQMISLTKKESGEQISIILDLIGAYQLQNSRTTFTAVDVMKNIGWKISEQAIINGFKEVKKNTGLKGRFDILQQTPLLITDVAHNEAGLNEVLKQINSFAYNKLHIVIGFVNDKDVKKVLALFPLKATYYFTQADIPRALPYEELADMGLKAGLHGEAFPNVTSAVKNALINAAPDDLILVTGSFFILADVYTLMAQKNSM